MPAGDVGRVAEPHRHRVGLDAERVGDDLRERRRVALPVRAGAAVRDHPAAELDGDPRLLELTAGALDVQRDAGADDALRVAAALRLHQLGGEVHAALVVARVVRPAERRLVRERAHEVAAPQLERVEPELARRLVDGQLEEGRRLRAPGAAARPDRHLVGARAGDGHAARPGSCSSRTSASRSCATARRCSRTGTRRGRRRSARARRACCPAASSASSTSASMPRPW